MKEPRKHLPGDLKALRYLEALNAADLEAVTALWEEATHDSELEQMLAELDGALFQEIPGKPILRAERVRRRHRWTVLVAAVGTMAAAGLLGILNWPPRDTQNHDSSPPSTQGTIEIAPAAAEFSNNLAPLLGARRDLDEAAIPRFVWPLENCLSVSTPLDLLD